MPTDAELEYAYSPAVEALLTDFDIWYENGGEQAGIGATEEFWAAATAVHGITLEQFNQILDVRLDNQMLMYRPWRSDRVE